MNQEVKDLIERIEKEVSEIQRIGELSLKHWEKALRDEDYLGSVAFDLHGFYHGVEKLFQIFARAIDGDVPSGEAWHRRLLAQMAEEAPGLRPAIISEQTRTALDAYRTFRHVARNVYTFNLDVRKMTDLVVNLAGTIEEVCSDIFIFLEFFKKMAEQTQQTQGTPVRRSEVGDPRPGKTGRKDQKPGSLEP